MLRKILALFPLIALCCFALRPLWADCAELQPILKPDGTKWRIGYYEGGAYNDYVPVTKAALARLAKLGWLPDAAMRCVDGAKDSSGLWACLSDNPGDYLEFPKDARWSANWEDERRAANRADFIKRARERHDLDLVFALGTWAGQDLASDEHDIPVVVCSTSNAIASGIIKSAEDSGFNHVHARVDPTRYARQVRLFHEIVGFSKLGVVFENSKEGRTYAGMDQIEPLAKELGFTLIACEAPFSGVSLAQAEDAVMACHEELAQKADAVYIAIHRGVNRQSIKRLLEPFFKRNIPTFAMGTLYEVNAGALMSMAQPNFTYAGDFYGDVAARVLHGERPRDIGQILPDPQDLRVNLETARLIGFHIPVDVLSDAEEILDGIEDVAAPNANAAK